MGGFEARGRSNPWLGLNRASLYGTGMTRQQAYVDRCDGMRMDLKPEDIIRSLHSTREAQRVTV